MYVPVITATSRRGNVINKTIIYSDTVLPLKEKGSNIVVTTLNNVNEYSLDSCLNIIFESNPDVIFNTIQYSKSQKRVYFYTDKRISLDKYNDSKVFKYKPIISYASILDEVKTVLTSPKIKDENVISLYDILRLFRKVRTDFDNIDDSYQDKLSYIMNRTFNDVGIIVYGYDYRKSHLRIGFRYVYDYDKIVFTKKNDDLIIVESESLHANDVLAAAGNELSMLYDLYEGYRDFNEQYNYGFNAVNSNFLINISSDDIGIFVRNGETYGKDFALTAYCYKMYDNRKYGYECNSNNVLNLIRGHEDDLFKNIYVKISDCPLWSQKNLYEVRQNQLYNDQILEDKIKYREMKQQKRLALKRKLFPFLKK